MSYTALARRYRSNSFDEVVGQEPIARTLKNAIDSGRVAHAYLFCGTRGIGKTSMARIFARAINTTADVDMPEEVSKAIMKGQDQDVIEIDAASNRSVEEARNLIANCVYRPMRGLYKVYIIDEVHMLSTSAFNALLKTLEEPPPHVIFILATTEVHKVPATVLSRCQRFDFHRIPPEKIVAHLSRVLEAEGVSYEPAALEAIAHQATGSLRDALSILDQVLASGGDTVSAELVRDVLGLPDAELVAGLVDAMLGQEIGRGLELINAAVEQGTDVRQLLAAVLDYLRALLLAAAGSRRTALPAEVAEALRRQAAGLNPQTLVPAIRAFNAAVSDLKLGLVPQLPLELAFVEATLALSPSGREVQGTSQEPGKRIRADDPRNGLSVATQRASSPATERGAPPPPPTPPPADATAPTPAPAAPKAPSSTVAEAEAGVETDEAGHDVLWWQHRWGDFLEWLRERGGPYRRLAVRLKFGHPHAIEQNTLQLSFAYSIHRDKVTEPETSRLLRRAIQEFAGASLAVECLWMPDRKGLSPARTKFEEATDDPLVRAALQLGGRIVDVRVPEQPTDN